MSKINKVLDVALSKAGLAKIRATVVKRGRQKSWLLTEIHRIAPDVGKCSNDKSCILILLKTEVNSLSMAKKVLPRLKELIPVLYNSQVNTIPAYMTRINNLFRDKSKELHEYSKTIMHGTALQKKARIKASNDAVARKNENMIELEYSLITKIIADCSRSPKFANKMIALELASGSRKVELLSVKVARFNPSTENPNWIEQDGVAKNKGAERNIDKPLLVLSNEQFLSLLDEVRTEVGDDVNLSNPELSTKYGDVINKRVKKLFPAAYVIRGRLGSHFLREIYANTSYHVFNHKPMPLTTWIAKFLGTNWVQRVPL